MFRLTNEDAKMVLFFQQASGASTRDCLDLGDRFVFVVSEGEMGRAIGKGGKNINALERLLRKKILIVEYSEEPIKFIRNIFFPIDVQIEKKNEGFAVTPAPADRKYVIGKGGEKIKLARALLERHFGVKDIKVL